MLIRCAACHEEVVLPEKVGFRDSCPSCHVWLHACAQCALWIKGQCTEPSAEKVRDPEGQNFCEWFAARTQDAGHRTQQDSAGSDRTAAEEMWKKLTKK